jgi:hypothetical protein
VGWRASARRAIDVRSGRRRRTANVEAVASRASTKRTGLE